MYEATFTNVLDSTNCSEKFHKIQPTASRGNELYIVEAYRDMWVSKSMGATPQRVNAS